MPNVSSEFLYLESRISDLKIKFLKSQLDEELVDPVTFTPDVEMIAAFKLLAHAEIEDYIEKKARKWIASKELLIDSGSYNIAQVLDLYPLLQLLKKEIPLDVPFDKNKCSTVLKAAFKDAREQIKENNGIKSESFTRLSLMCGKLIDEIDSSISVLLTQYGKARGDVAHVSTARAENIQAPSVEARQVEQILLGLKTYFYS